MADLLRRGQVFSISEARSRPVSSSSSSSISNSNPKFGRSYSYSGLSFSRSNEVPALRSSSSFSERRNEILGKPSFMFGDLPAKLTERMTVSPNASSGETKTTLSFPKSIKKWWEKGVQPNMKEIESPQDLVDSLLLAGDKLVIVDFFSPGCGGCKALHPKICQFAEKNPDVLFLQVNYEEHRSMCHSLNVHVLPFFRFYRGANGRLCSFSCTNATIKKFKDALAKHSTERCSLGPAKGLEESELQALAANKELSFAYQQPALPSHVGNPDDMAEPGKKLPHHIRSQSPLSRCTNAESEDNKSLAAAQR